MVLLISDNVRLKFMRAIVFSTPILLQLNYEVLVAKITEYFKIENK